jgi:hypothetical protein
MAWDKRPQYHMARGIRERRLFNCLGRKMLFCPMIPRYLAGTQKNEIKISLLVSTMPPTSRRRLLVFFTGTASFVRFFPSGKRTR